MYQVARFIGSFIAFGILGGSIWGAIFTVYDQLCDNSRTDLADELGYGFIGFVVTIVVAGLAGAIWWAATG